MEKFQYRNLVFGRDEHCPTCSLEIVRKSVNSTAGYAFGMKCNHPKKTKLFLFQEKPWEGLRKASKVEEKMVAEEYYT